ncbi:hypothetical protein pdam_00007400 [Pocillopora damicornis]|uniref:Nck-associated protein 1 n=1 Tax=Pocillopora damicornis TaxID=46731 RepID=A0A3M6V5T4_POCDA|nr:hypothetical protein pdam_00007400 [Pocillopora damicornis]
MDRGVSVTEQRLAEKLTILNDRGIGMLTRIYNIKKACSDSKSRPGFLTDKALDPAIKAIVKKFPVTDTKSVALQPVHSIQNEVIKGLSNYYYTFVDVMEFRDNTSELLTEIDASFVHFDIALNYDLTKAYLDVIVTYATLMMLVARVDDRKAVLGLFNHAYEMKNGRGEDSFPRLGSMIVEYESPLKKIAEQFVPHQQRVSTALHSVHEIYLRRNTPGEQWRQTQIVSIISAPLQMLNPVTSDVPPVEYLSLDRMQKWILFGYTLCHQQLAMPGVTDIWKIALQDGYCVTLFRDEVIMYHKEFQNLLDGMKGYGKRVKDIQDAMTHVLTRGPIHKERRNYLRTALREMSLILSDQPGLLGPKIIVVLQALSMTRDEIMWLVRHTCNPPPKGRKLNQEDYVDNKLPQLLLYVEEVRGIIQKYVSVLQRYFVQYLGGFDVAVLKEVVQKISVCSDDISIIMTSFIEDLTLLNVKQVEAGDTFDFESLRLDWMRLQAYTSVRGAAPELKDNRDLAVLMNNVAFHSKLVDTPERLLNEISDLFSVAFPLICGHFMSCTSDFCPEERHPIGDRSLAAVNLFLESMAKEARNILSQLCPDHIHLNQQLWQLQAVSLMTELSSGPKKDKNKKNVQNEYAPPGSESFRKSRETLSALDGKLIALTEICRAITYTEAIPVWEHIFAPREYLNSQLEEFFTKSVVTMAQFDSDNLRIARPSEVLSNIKATMASLRGLENYTGVDMARLFNHVLLQQTQPEDSQGAITITNMYATWYLDVFLRRVMTDNIVFSPRRRAFVNKPGQSFRAEEYTDVNELQALAELLGAYGMKYLGQKMMQQVASQVGEIKKLVVLNKDVLTSLRTSFDKPDQCMELVRRLKNIEDLIIRVIIVGVILTFRSLTQEALETVLKKRVPFLMNCIVDFKEHFPHGNNDRPLVEEMATSAGLQCELDPVLCEALRVHKEKKSDEDSVVWALFLVFVAVALPSLAYRDSSDYNADLEAHENNAHCMSASISRVAGALCFNNGDSAEERLREFLAIASSSLLKLGIEAEKDLKARESTYLLLDLIVKDCPYLTMDVLESCFPYALLRNAYHEVYKKARSLALSMFNCELEA